MGRQRKTKQEYPDDGAERGARWRPSAAASMVLVVTLAALAFAGWRMLARRGEAADPANPGAASGSGAGQPAAEEVLETEPNDSLVGCQLLPRASRQVVRGRIAAGNEDWFCPASPGFASNLRVALSAVPGCDLELQVLDSLGKPLRTAVATGAGTPRVIDNSGASLAARAIVVRPKAGCRDEKGGGYELRLEVLKSVQVDWEKEPNDVPDKGNQLRRGSVMVGFLTKPTDIDCYSLPTQPAPADSRLRVEVIPLPSLALRIVVQGADGGLLYRAEGKPGEPLVLRGLGVRSWEGYVVIMITAVAGGGPRRAYTLRGELETVGGPFEFEPNNEPIAATPLPLVPGPGMVVSGYLATANDVDYFGVTAAREAPLTFSMEQIPEGLAPTVAVLDAKGTTVVTCDAGKPCQGRPPVAGRVDVNVDRPTRGSYTIKISADAGRHDDERAYRVRARYRTEAAKDARPARSK